MGFLEGIVIDYYTQYIFSKEFTSTFNFGRKVFPDLVWNFDPLFKYTGELFKEKPIVNNENRDVAIVCSKLCNDYELYLSQNETK